MKKFSLTLVLSCLAVISFGQLLPNIGQFQYGQLVYNPAYAGSSTSLRGTLIHRSQFIGVNGAPNTQLLFGDAPIANNLGAGGVLTRHKVGDFMQLDFAANMSYRIKIDKDSYLQFGLKAGLSQFFNKFSDSFVWDDNDPMLDDAGKGSLIRFGTGAFYKRKNFYAGLSSPDLIFIDVSNVFFDDVTQESTLRNNYVLNVGGSVFLNEFTSLLPNLMIRYYQGHPVNYYINVGVELNQTVIAGVSLINPMALGLYTRVSISPKINIGYHYEFNMNNVELGPFNTNEITLSYGFN